MGIAPQPWDVRVECPKLFEEKTYSVPVPHTEMISQCRKCFGRGRVQCRKCLGRGREECSWCHGSGRETRNGEHVHCNHCNGSGSTRCFICNGDGMTSCGKCDSTGTVVLYVLLTVKFENCINYEIINADEIPDETIRDASSSIMSQ